jgi:aminoglycoside 3-N-acetyltransferase I
MDKTSVSYKRLQAGDESLFAELVKLFNVEFENPDVDYVNVENIKSLLTKPDFVCFVALSEAHVVGGLTGYSLKMYAQEGTTMYLYDMAVANNYQRKGIGSKLVSELKTYCAQHGIRDMYVQADVSDDHALAFYKNLGGEPADVVHFTFDTSE